MIFKKQERILQSLGEEIANAITHGIGFILSFIGLYILINNSIRARSTLCVASCSIYGGSLVILYFMSTLYHSCSKSIQERIKAYYHKDDQRKAYTNIYRTLGEIV